MFGERTSSEESDARGRADCGRFGRALVLLVAGLAGALAILVLASRRGNDATLEPPF
jgi:hypothetical protein